MTDEDYIRQAVELADEFEYSAFGDLYMGPVGLINGITQPYIDALAAQLVRQVDALPVGKFPDDAPTDIYILNGSTDIWHKKRLHAQAKGPDRTMNTIKAIVDSGVLDHARAALKAQDSEVET